ncbi:cysteine-rich venom protein VAR8-like [Gigantopelta aegis]|uniref:cysteine-rich venom protein VAR8-like n=1 Tax=Gigantopelta aegis TaxID=1735272 RepID=UPI001B88C1CC|nr:cysteine-rich venom protein VAR8-like [Gigantopelta aegis]XP_041359635.1 cysteine-rich venom protein VAR8-like [Gigantopelta aegis]
MARFCACLCLAFLFTLNEVKAQIQIDVSVPGEGAGEEPETPPAGSSYQYYTYYTRQSNNVRPPLRQFRWNNNGIRFGGNRMGSPTGQTSYSRQPFQYVKKFFWWTPKQQQRPNVRTNALPYSGGFGLQYRHMVKLLNDHNTVRSSLRAANVYKMKWSNQLAREALAWIQHCQMQHQQQGRGENLAMVYGHGVNVDMLVNTAVNGWYQEKNMWRYGDGFSSATGHYTQMIWCSSKVMGCAAKQCPDKLLLACFYSPQGNIIGQLPYKIGPPCSQCQPNTRCQANLCLW